jgi:hypothetical protein
MSTKKPAAKAPSLKASKAAAKAPSAAKVLKLDAATGQMKAVPAKKPAMAAVAETLTVKATREAERAKRYPTAAKQAKVAPSRMSTSQYPTQALAVQAAIGAKRPKAGIFQREPGVFCYASRRAGTAKGWVFMGRAASLQKLP